MTGKEVQQALQALDMSPMQMGSLLEVDYATAKRWRSRGTRGPAAILMRMLSARKIKTSTVRKYHEGRQVSGMRFKS
jgi:hypothetical protein